MYLLQFAKKIEQLNIKLSKHLNKFNARMRSSRMRTDHNRIGGGGEGGVWPGVCLSRGWGVSVRGGGCLDGQTPPPLAVDRMTHACENFTFPHTTYAVGNKEMIIRVI